MSSRPRLLFINRSYWPDAEATGQLLAELCEDLAESFDVSVIAGQPNANPDGAKYRAWGSEVRRGVTIRRVWHTRLSKSSLVGRAINFVTFLAGAFVAAFAGPRPDVVVVETDPPLLCVLGSWLKRLRGSELVVYLQDINPDIAVALGRIRRGWLTNTLRKQFAAIYRGADQIVVLSSDMRRVLEEWQVPAQRIATIPNWVDTSAVVPVKENNRFRQAHGLADKFVVMYSGNLGLCQQLTDVVLAAEQLRERPEIVFVLIGGGSSQRQLEQMVNERGLTNVRFFDYQPKGELSTSLSAADLHLAPLDQRIVRYMMPCKLYGILASGTPLIAVAPEGCELAQVVREEDVGFVTPPGDFAALAEQIGWCAENRRELADLGARARQLATERFDRKLITSRFGRLLADLLGLPEPAPAGEARNLACSTPWASGKYATSARVDSTQAVVEQL